MLHITGSMKTLKGELQSAKSFCMSVIGVLQQVNPETNLTREVGVFAVEKPEYKILCKDADAGVQIIRKVCTGEVSPHEARTKFQNALSEINELLKMMENIS